MRDDYHPDWKSRRPPPSAKLKGAKRACDKQIAHMTGLRRDLNFAPGHQHWWPIVEIKEELQRVLTVFLHIVPDQMLDPEALAGLRTLQQIVRNAVPTPSSFPENMCAKTCPPTTDIRTINPSEDF